MLTHGSPLGLSLEGEGFKGELFAVDVFFVDDPQAVEGQGRIVNVDRLSLVGDQASEAAGCNHLQVC